MRTGYRDRISVNARCVEGIDIFTLEVKRYDGRNLMPPGRLNLPTLFVLEGGYATEALGVNAVKVLSGFEGR